MWVNIQGRRSVLFPQYHLFSPPVLRDVSAGLLGGLILGQTDHRCISGLGLGTLEQPTEGMHILTELIPGRLYRSAAVVLTMLYLNQDLTSLLVILNEATYSRLIYIVYLCQGIWNGQNGHYLRPYVLWRDGG